MDLIEVTYSDPRTLSWQTNDITEDSSCLSDDKVWEDTVGGLGRPFVG